MADPIRPAIEAAAEESGGLAVSNADRLKGHLKTEGLAAVLFQAWLAGPRAAAPQRLLAALNKFQTPGNDDDTGATPED